MDIKPADRRIETLIANTPMDRAGEGTEVLKDAQRILRESLRRLSVDTDFQKVYRQELAERISIVRDVKSKGRSAKDSLILSTSLPDTYGYISQTLKNRLSTDSSPGGKYLNEFFNLPWKDSPLRPVCEKAREFIAFEGAHHIVTSIVQTIFDATNLTFTGYKIASFEINLSGNSCSENAAETMMLFKEHDPKIAEMNAKIPASTRSRHAENRHHETRTPKSEKTIPAKVETKAVEAKRAGVVETFRNFWRALRGIRK